MDYDNQEVSSSALDQMVDRKAATPATPRERYSTNHLGSPVALRPQEIEDTPAPKSWAMRQIDSVVSKDVISGKMEKLDNFGLGLARKNNFVLRTLSRKIGRQIDMTLPKQGGLRKLELSRQAQIMRTVSANAALGNYQFQRTQMLPFMRKSVALNYQKVSILKQVVTSISTMEKAVVSKLEAIKLNTGASAPAKLGLFKQLSIATREKSIGRAATNISNFWMDGYEAQYRNHVSPRLARVYNKLAMSGATGGVNGVTSAATAKVDALKDYLKSVAGKDKAPSMMGRMGQAAARASVPALGAMAKLGQMTKMSAGKNDFITKLVNPTAERASKFSPFSPLHPFGQHEDTPTQTISGPKSDSSLVRQFKLWREEAKTYHAQSLDHLGSIRSSLEHGVPGTVASVHHSARQSSPVSTAPLPTTTHTRAMSTMAQRIKAVAGRVPSLSLPKVSLPKFKLPRVRALSSASHAVASVDLATAQLIAGAGIAIGSARASHATQGVSQKAKGLFSKASGSLKERAARIQADRLARKAESKTHADERKAAKAERKQKTIAQRLVQVAGPRKNSYEDFAEKARAIRVDAAAKVAAARLAMGAHGGAQGDHDDHPQPDTGAPKERGYLKSGVISALGTSAAFMGKRVFKGGLKTTKWLAGKSLKLGMRVGPRAGRLGLAGGALLARFARREAVGTARLAGRGVGGAARLGGRGLSTLAKFGGAKLFRFAKSPMGIGMGAAVAKHFFDKSGVKGDGKRAGDTALDMLSYGSTGAMIGSFVPVIGTAVGALVGAGYGLIKSNMDVIHGQDAVVDTDGHVIRKRRGNLFSNLQTAFFGRKAEYSKTGELIQAGRKSVFGNIEAGVDSFFNGRKNGKGNRVKGTSLMERISAFNDKQNKSFGAIGTGIKTWFKGDPKKPVDPTAQLGLVGKSIKAFGSVVGGVSNFFGAGSGTQTVMGKGRSATPDEVKAMAMQAMPGARVTSTTGGKHAPHSYHYKGQAIDFVPPGGMGSMTKADVYRKFQAMGLNIVQLLGPGDAGHSDHFHVAWSNGNPNDKRFFGKTGVQGIDTNAAFTTSSASNDNGGSSSFFGKNNVGGSDGSGGFGAAPSTKSSAKMAAGNVGKQPEYLAAYKKLPEAIRKMVDKSPQLRFVLWSTAVQHGPDTASSIFQKDYNPGLDEKAYTRSIYNQRSTRFTNSSEQDRTTAVARLSREEAFTESFRNGAKPTRDQFKEQLTDMITPGAASNYSVSKGGRAQMAFDFFKNRGYSPIAAAGVVAQLMAESRVDPHPSGSNDNGRAHGVAQWHRDRQEAIARQFGKPVQEMNLTEQLAAVDWEIKNGINGKGNGIFNRLNQARSLEESVAIGVDNYEMPADREGAKRDRTGLANELMQVMGNQPTKPKDKPQASTEAAQSSPQASGTKPQPSSKPQSKAQPQPAKPQSQPVSHETINNFTKALADNTAALANRGNHAPLIQQHNTRVTPFLNTPQEGNFITMNMKKSKLAAGSY